MPDWSFINQKNQLDELHTDLDKKKSEGMERGDEGYTQLLIGKFNFLKKAKRFLTARSKSGQDAKKIKDMLLPLLPYKKIVKPISNLITTILGGNKMPTEELPTKPPQESKTIWANIIVGVVSLLVLTGVISVDPDALNPDAAWVGIAMSIINIILRLVTGKPVALKSG